MRQVRIRFKKEGKAKYISHLDLNRVMQRALRRARIPVWRTQGFNPHPYIAFAMPLSLFYESDCEAMDIKLEGDMPLEEVSRRLSREMPQGIVITGVALPEMKFTEIGFAEYAVSIVFEGKPQRALSDMLSRLLSRETVLIEKHTKRHTMEYDIKGYLQNADIAVRDGLLEMKAVLPAGQAENVNPSCFSDAFERYEEKPDAVDVRRLRIFSRDMRAFL